MNEQIKALLTARLTQLGSRYIGAFLVAKAGYDAAQADAAVLAVVQVALAAILFLADQVISRVRSAQKIETAKEEAKAEVIADAFPDSLPVSNRYQLALVLAAGLAFSAVGCAGNVSPQVQVARQEQAFTLGIEAINAGLQSGRLDKKDFVKLRPLVIAVNAYLDEAKAAASTVAGLKARLDAAVDAADRAALQAQIDVANDQFVRVLRALTASLKALNAAQQEAESDVPAAPGTPAVQPPAAPAPQSTATGRHEPARLGPARFGVEPDRAPAFAGA